jgi:hypothetical protein
VIKAFAAHAAHIFDLRDLHDLRNQCAKNNQLGERPSGKGREHPPRRTKMSQRAGWVICRQKKEQTVSYPEKVSVANRHTPFPVRVRDLKIIKRNTYDRNKKDKRNP